MDRMLLISADCHAAPASDAYATYLEARYHPQLEDYVAGVERRRSEAARTRADRSVFEKELRNASQEALQRDYERRAAYATQLPVRLAALEADGFVGEVLFPDGSANNQIPFASRMGGPAGHPYDLYAAALRAYNRWLAETAEPERQIGLGLVPLHDPPYAAEQARAVAALGLRGVLLEWDSLDPHIPALHDPAFDPLWAACAEHRLPVHFHGGTGLPAIYRRDSAPQTMTAISETVFWSRRPLWHLVWGGVLERHPALLLVFTEVMVDWIPRTLEYMDWQWRIFGGADIKEYCPEPPSSYWRRQCYAGASTPSIGEELMRDAIGMGAFMYGTDFPHPISPWGVSNAFLRATLPPASVSESEARAILGENAARLYRVDLAKVAPVAERVGPRPEDLLGEGAEAGPGLPAFHRDIAHRPLSIP
jgi:predicted TIM-barrel fold metal-dependent hydrolase